MKATNNHIIIAGGGRIGEEIARVISSKDNNFLIIENDEAKVKAEVLAKELGVKLGKVVNFSENSGGNYPVMYEKSMMASDMSTASAAPTLPKGENKITSEVNITFEIK